MSYIIKTLIQNQYWKPKSIGYTKNLNEVGFYPYEVAHDYCRLANTNGKINLVMTSSDDLSSLQSGELTLPSEQQKKKPISEVLESMGNTNSLETNPISLLMKTLNDNHYYPDENHDQLKYFGKHINYGETFEENLKIFGEYDNQEERSPLFVKMNIYRKDNGLYEMVAYENYGEPEYDLNLKQKQTSKNKQSRKNKM